MCKDSLFERIIHRSVDPKPPTSPVVFDFNLTNVAVGEKDVKLQVLLPLRDP